MTALLPKSTTPPLRLQLFPQVTHTPPPPDSASASDVLNSSSPRRQSRGRNEVPSRSKSSSPGSDIDAGSSQYHSVSKRRSNSLPRPSSRKGSVTSSVPLPSAVSSPSVKMPLGRTESNATLASNTTSATIAIALASNQYQSRQSDTPESPDFAQQMLDPLQADDCVVQEPRAPKAPKPSSTSSSRRALQPVSVNVANPSHKRSNGSMGKGPAPRHTSASRLALLNAKEEEIKKQIEERRRLREGSQPQPKRENEACDSQAWNNQEQPSHKQRQHRTHNQRPVSPPRQAAAETSRPSAPGIGVGISSSENTPKLAPEERNVVSPAASSREATASSPPAIRSRFPQFDPLTHTSSSGTATPSNGVSSVPAAYQSPAMRTGPVAVPVMPAPAINISPPLERSESGQGAHSAAHRSVHLATPGYSLPPDTLSQPSPSGGNDLKILWDVSNGMHVDDAQVLLQTASDVFCFPLLPADGPEPEPVKGMIRPSPLLFGPAPGQRPVFSVRQAAFPAPEDPVQPHEREHELIVFRHHPCTDSDALPIAHVGLVPPPPPDLSTSRGLNTPYTVPGTPMGTAGAKTHICSVTPVLANLQALDAVASTPLGQRLALSDPQAQSAEAQQLAQTVLAETAQREAGHVYWAKTGPATGEYEIHHSAFDGQKLIVLVSGDFSRTPFGAQGQADRRKPHQRSGSQYRFGITDRETAITIWAPEQLYSKSDQAESGTGNPDVDTDHELDTENNGSGATKHHSMARSLKLDTSTPTIRGRGHFSFSSTAAHRSSRVPQSSSSAVPPVPAAGVAGSLVPGIVQAHMSQAPLITATHRPLLSFNLSTGNMFLYPHSLLPLISRSRFIFDLLTSTALVVAAAEGRRGVDRGLFFAAPPKPNGGETTTASSSHTSVASVFSNRGRESADSGATDDDGDEDGRGGGKSILNSIKSKFTRRQTRGGDVEMGPVDRHHSRHYGQSGHSSLAQLNPSHQSFPGPPTNPQSPFSAGSQPAAVAGTWPRSITEIQNPSSWSGQLTNVVDGITGDLGLQTREQRQAHLRREHAQMLKEMEDARLATGSGPSRRARRKAKKSAQAVDEAKHSWPTRVIVGTVVFGFKMVLWVVKLFLKICVAVFKVLTRSLDKK